jgi:uncharacterized membrane-anchored protein YjiN (DUF445 family)
MKRAGDAAPDRVRRLRRAKLMATGAVLAAAGLFAGAHLLPVPPFWRGLIGAAGEAGTVGGLADWFAVTALFRHPLGLPIPHTALIRSRKDEIGRALARFLEEHFLDPGLLMDWVKAGDPALRLGRWLQTPEASVFVAGRLEEVLRGLVRAGAHLDLVDSVLPVLKGINDGLEDALVREVGRRTGPLVPLVVDRRLAKAGTTVLGGLIKALGTPGSPERAALDRWLRERVAEVPEDVRQSAQLVLDELKAGADTPASPALSRSLAALIERAGGALIANPAMRERINAGIERLVIDYIVPWRRQISQYIEDVVRQWNPDQVTRLIELQVGHDLQFIRLNGTAIGALIGVGLYLAARLSGVLYP